LARLSWLGNRVVTFAKNHRWKGYGLFFLWAGFKGLEASNVPSDDDEKYKHAFGYPKHGVDWDSEATADELMAAIREQSGALDDVRTLAPELGKYLAGNRSFDYSTGKERQLWEWVNAQRGNSITPGKLFAKALELNGGKIGEALLCTHQLLRNEARFKSDYIRGSFTKSDEEQKFFFDRFRDIRGDLVEVGGPGDHPGSWYRMFGVVLNVYGTSVHSVKEGTESPAEVGPGNYPYDLFQVSMAEWIKPVIRWPERDTSKAAFNRHSVNVGHALLWKLKELAETPSRGPAFY